MAYGTDPRIETEIKGTIITLDGDNIYAMPDDNYLNLLVKGNFIHPNSGQSGYERWRDNILANYQRLGSNTDSQDVNVAENNLKKSLFKEMYHEGL